MTALPAPAFATPAGGGQLLPPPAILETAQRRSPRVTLGGVVLEGQDTYDWPLVSGVSAPSVTYTVTLDCAARLFPLLGQPQQLIIEGLRKTLIYEGIIPLEFYPATRFTHALALSDKRERWAYEWLAPGWFNRRRETGTRRLLNDQGAPENAVSEPRFLYEPTSLFPFGSTPGVSVCTARKALEHLLRSPPPDGLGVDRLEFRLAADQEGVEVESLYVNDPAPVALERLLAYMSGVSLFQSRSGAIVVYDTRSRLGEAIARRTRLGRLGTGPESLEVERNARRPRETISLFAIDCELRLDWTEPTTGGSQTAVSEIDQPELVNIARVTEAQVEVDGAMQARGSYVRNTSLFTAWGAFGRTPRVMTLDDLRRLTFETAGARFESFFSHNAAGVMIPVHARRASEARDTFRRLFRIAPTFFGRLESISPVRAAIINQETGARAPAAVYSSYIRKPAIRGLTRGILAEGLPNGWAVEVTINVGTAITADTHVAPVGVHLADAGVGVLELIPMLDVARGYDEIILGFPTGGAAQIPLIDGLGAANKAGIIAGDVLSRWSSLELRAAHSLAIILSVTPATPSNRTRFFEIRTTNDQASGPPMYSFIPPGLVTARVAWNDAKREQIVGAIKGEASWQSLEEQIVNLDHLHAVHAANVRRIADQFRDRTYGGHDVDMDPELEPAGSLATVRHIMAGGATVTQLRWPGDARPLDIWRFLDTGTRTALLRIMQARPQAGAT